MPKAWRKCYMCPVDSYNRPDLVIFSTQVKYSTASVSRFVCELHYQPEDMKVHGSSKRFVLQELNKLTENINDIVLTG